MIRDLKLLYNKKVNMRVVQDMIVLQANTNFLGCYESYTLPRY